ncbi:MAG: hypothetical protein AB7S38_18270 [Vulcanimicrobiota bacterium]
MKKRGIALVVALMIGTVLTAGALTLGVMAHRGLGQVGHAEQQKVEYFAALAGLHSAMAQLRSQPTFPGPILGTTSGGQSYEVSLVNNLSGSAPITAPDGTEVPAGGIYLVSVAGSQQLSGLALSVAE